MTTSAAEERQSGLEGETFEWDPLSLLIDTFYSETLGPLLVGGYCRRELRLWGRYSFPEHLITLIWDYYLVPNQALISTDKNGMDNSKEMDMGRIILDDVIY